jgi:hypothetical protein
MLKYDHKIQFLGNGTILTIKGLSLCDKPLPPCKQNAKISNYIALRVWF